MIVFVSSFLMTGCGSKTEVRYITPTGYAMMEQPKAQPVQVSITESNGSGSDKTAGYNESAVQNKTTQQDNGYSTVVKPAFETDVNGSYTTKDASIDEIKAKLCSINDVILGYIGCYYDESKTSVKITLKNSGRGDVWEMWFYILTADKTGYAKSEGFGSGYINDYKLPILEWTQKHGRIQRILVTPMVKEGNTKYACNNRQLLLLPEVNCREMAG